MAEAAAEAPDAVTRPGSGCCAADFGHMRDDQSATRLEADNFQQPVVDGGRLRQDQKSGMKWRSEAVSHIAMQTH